MNRALVVRRGDNAAGLEVEVDADGPTLWFIDESKDAHDEIHLIAMGDDVLKVLDELREFARAALREGGES